MCKILFRGLTLIQIMLFTSNVWALDFKEILKKADSYRISTSSSKVETEVELYKNDKLDKRKKYRVYVKPGRRSLVLFMSANEQGQKVLMLEDNFWIMMPTSRRAIRITPMQKLIGEASTGDIATMTWSEFYGGEILNADTLYEKTPAIYLNLKSQVKGTTYENIKLFVSKESFAPLAADLYVKSGKMAKQAKYFVKDMGNREMVFKMVLLDRIQKDRRTEVFFNSIVPFEMPDKYFNPMFLVRNDIQE